MGARREYELCLNAAAEAVTKGGRMVNPACVDCRPICCVHSSDTVVSSEIV